jgi:hypothetical protein
MGSKPMLEALLTSIAYEPCDSSLHGLNTEGRTNEDQLKSCSYLTERTRHGAQNA